MGSARGVHPLGNEAEIFMIPILGEKICYLGETNVFVNLGGRKCHIFVEGEEKWVQENPKYREEIEVKGEIEQEGRK